MTSSGVVEIQQIRAMLAECAPGHTITTTEHYHCVMWNKKTYPSLPLGAHGRNATARPKSESATFGT
jgi:hypothetical protein